MVFEMVWANKDGPTALSMKVNGSLVKQTVMASCIMLMVTFMREIGLTIKQTAKEHTLMLMGQSTLVNGKMTNSMVSVSKPGQTEQFMKVSTLKVRSMDLAS